MKAILIGPDRELAAALEDAGIETRRIETATGAALEAAGVDAADLLVVTAITEATVIPVAKDLNPALRVVVYAPDTIPDYVRRQVDIAVDPELLSAAIVAEELAGADA